MGNTLSNHLTFPFQVKELPAERSAVEARIVFLERQVFLLGRWLFVLGAHFLLPAGRLHWVIYLGYAALCMIYTLGLLTSGRASRRIALVQGMIADLIKT